jgi:hypothetical protein
MGRSRDEKRQEKADDRAAREARDEATIRQVHKILQDEGQIVPPDEKK